MSTLAPTAKPFKPGCVPDTIPKLSSVTKNWADDSSSVDFYDTLSDASESNSEVKILPEVRFSSVIYSYLRDQYSFLSRIIIISVSNSLSEDNRHRLATSPQETEELEFFKSSFTGKKKELNEYFIKIIPAKYIIRNPNSKWTPLRNSVNKAEPELVEIILALIVNFATDKYLTVLISNKRELEKQILLAIIGKNLLIRAAHECSHGSSDG